MLMPPPPPRILEKMIWLPIIRPGVDSQLRETTRYVGKVLTCSAALGRGAQFSVEPLFLARAHQRPRGFVADQRDVALVVSQAGDAPVVVAGVDDDEVEELAHLEGAPDAEIVVEIYLAVGMVWRVRY